MTGFAQALIFPATLGLVSRQIRAGNLGAAMGFVGMMQNLGKVLGPVAGGLLIGLTGFEKLLWLLAALLTLGVMLFRLLRSMPRHSIGKGQGEGRRDEAGSRSVAKGHTRALPT